jgi:glucokinase
MIIAGDIGGTKCNLAAFEEEPGKKLHLVFQRRYLTRDFAAFEQLVGHFCQEVLSKQNIAGTGGIAAAGFGFPGTIVLGRLHAFNLPWELDATSLAHILSLPAENVVLMNDLVATACGLDRLVPEDLLVLNPGVAQPTGNKALIAAGTGLGEAVLYWDGRRHRAAASEGGAADFAPRTEREIRLLVFLKQRLSRVSCEDVFSGRGFRSIHEFLGPGVRHSTFAGAPADSAREITQNALEGTCSVCVEALDLWTEAFGAEAGNLALRVLSYGGVYLAGGIAVKILPMLKQGSFGRAFAEKGPMTEILARIPIAVILNEDAPVLGAAYQALASAHCKGCREEYL